MDITPSSPRISPWQFLALRFLHRPWRYARLLHFYPSSSIVSNWASFLIGSSDARLLILTYGANYPSWSASIIWQHSLCFYCKPCVLDTNIMRHSLFGDCTDALDTLRQSCWSDSALSVWDTHNWSRVLPSLGSCPKLDTHPFKEIQLWRRASCTSSL